MRTQRIVGPLALLCTLAAVAGDAGAQTLRGSRASVNRMYSQAHKHDLTFYRTARGVRGAAEDGKLVRLSGNDDYRLAGVEYPYALSTTRTFIRRLAAQYHEACGERLVVTSAVRPTTYRLINSVEKSVHPAGMAVDIRKPQRAGCLGWLRETLLHVESEGAIEATEERRPPHFHVAVFPRQYLAYIGGSPDTRPQVSRREGRSASSPRRGGGAATYRVRQGDSLWAIARRHNTSVSRLKEANDMRSSRVLPGQVIKIPTER
jgi:hypothetical protein